MRARGAARRRDRTGREVQRDPDRRARRAAQRLHRPAVREQQVVRDAQRGRPVADARRLDALGVAEERDDPRLVVRDPARRPRRRARPPSAPRTRRSARRCRAPPSRRPPAAPAAGPSGRASPPARCRARAGPRTAAGRSRRRPRFSAPAPVRLHARPGDREAVGLDAQRRHQVQVLAPAVVVVARDVAGVAARHRARAAAERVPDRLAAPVLVDRALDLVRGHGDAEAEAERERARATAPARLRRCVIPSPRPRSGPSPATAGWRRRRSGRGAWTRRLRP